MLVLASAEGTLPIIFGVVAVFFGAVNVVGGFVVTDRMLQMFKRKR
jgi:NAD(P) transhydrogenase subunit alpha